MKKILFLIAITIITMSSTILGSSQMPKSKNNSPLRASHIQVAIDSELLAQIDKCKQTNQLVVIDDTTRFMASKHLLNQAAIHNVTVSPYSPRRKRK